MRKHGERRPDGARFWSYKRNKMNELVEVWITEAAFLRCKERNKNSHKKKPQKYRDKTRRWAQMFPDLSAEKRDRYQNRIKTQTNLGHADRLKIRMIYKICRRISKCLQIRHDVDHIVPLYKGGIHHPSNLQILPARLNQIKSYKVPVNMGRGNNLAAYGDATGSVAQ
jgi:hypothetical protein